MNEELLMPAPVASVVQPASPPVGQQPMGELLAPNSTPQIGPPATAQEFEERKSGWARFAERLATDPSAQQLMLGIGLRLMQPVPAGQTTGGHAAAGISDAMAYTANYQRLQAEEARKAALAKSTIAQETEQTRGATQTREQAATQFPQRQELLDQQLRESKLKLQAAEMEKRDLDAKFAAGLIASPEYHAKQAELARRLAEAKIDHEKANTEFLKARGEWYGADRAAGRVPVRQLQSTTVEPSGATLKSYVINGQTHYERVHPPMDSKEATRVANEQVRSEMAARGESVPGWWERTLEPGGSERMKVFETAVAKRVLELQQGRVEWFDATGKRGAPVGAGLEGGATPSSSKAPATGATRSALDELTRAKPVADQQRMAILQAELANAGTPQERAAIQVELDEVNRIAAGGTPSQGRIPPVATGTTPGAPVERMKLVRGADGQPMLAGTASTTAAPSPHSVAGRGVPKLVPSGEKTSPPSPPISVATEAVSGKVGPKLRAAKETTRTTRVQTQAVNGLRDIIRSGEFTLDQEEIVRDAIASGMLTPEELAIANAMWNELSTARVAATPTGTVKTGK